MRQLVLLFILFVAVLRVMKMLRRAQSQAARPDARAGATPSRWPGNTDNTQTDPARGVAMDRNGADGDARAEPMICCARCGVHVPKSEAVIVAGAAFCCNEHAR